MQVLAMAESEARKRARSAQGDSISQKSGASERGNIEWCESRKQEDWETTKRAWWMRDRVSECPTWMD